MSRETAIFHMFFTAFTTVGIIVRIINIKRQSFPCRRVHSVISDPLRLADGYFYQP